MVGSTEPSTDRDAERGLRWTIGLVLLTVGFVLAIWTFFQVYGILADPEGFALLRTLSAVLPRDRSIVLPEGTIEVPPVFVKIGAYGTAIGLLAICGGIANTLVRSGVRLVKR
jgi:hypothetical protein